MIYKKYCLILLLCFFSWSAFAQSLVRGLLPEYEPCSCTNDKFTKQLTQPYREEIQTWLMQTQEERIQPMTDDTIAMEEPTEEPVEDTSFFESVGNFFTDIVDTLHTTWESTREIEEEEQRLLQLPPLPPPPSLSTPIIPSICFAMSVDMINNEGTKKQFYSCIHEHYDNSDEDNFCFDTRNQLTSPKKCDVLPIPCDSANDLNLTCPQEYRERIEQHGPTGCNKGAAFPRRPCLNQDYVSMTAKAFHDVAKCLDIAPELAFPIFLHESRFILNIQSHTGALCYGQITGNAVADFNSFLKSHKGYPNYDIPDLLEKNIENRCPHIWKHFKKVSTIVRENKTITRSDFDQCNINTNPYTCFFYSFAYLKILYEKAKKEVPKVNNTRIVVLQNNLMMFLEDLKDFPSALNTIETKEIKLFADEQDLINILTATSYNGGLSIMQIHFKSFIAKLRTSILTPDNTELRSTIFNEGGLSSDFFKKEFADFLKGRYFIADERRNGELFSYLDKVIYETKVLNQLIRELYPYMPDTFDTCPSLLQ